MSEKSGIENQKKVEFNRHIDKPRQIDGSGSQNLKIFLLMVQEQSKMVVFRFKKKSGIGVMVTRFPVPLFF